MLKGNLENPTAIVWSMAVGKVRAFSGGILCCSY
jgi:hypothetical protein